jgi:hypothetical protein
LKLAFLIVLGLTHLLLVGQAINLYTLRRGDGFSRSIAGSLGALCTCVMCGLIAVLLGLARSTAEFPALAGWAVIVLLPVGLAAMLRVNHLMRSYEHPRWFIVCVVLPAGLLIALSVAVQFRNVPEWLNEVGISAALWLGAMIVTAIPLLRRQQK